MATSLVTAVGLLTACILILAAVLAAPCSWASRHFVDAGLPLILNARKRSQDIKLVPPSSVPSALGITTTRAPRPGAHPGPPSNQGAPNRNQGIQLVPPSTGPYKLDVTKVYYSQWGQDRKLWQPVLSRIDGLRQGGYKPFFVESGALNGELDSNSLYLEKSQHWQGLLVEPSKAHFSKLIKKGRKCWAFNGVLSPVNGSATLTFNEDGGGMGHAVGYGQGPRSFTQYKVRAEPLSALLQKVRPPVHTVDFWSLDIEGTEGPVLEHTDFNKVEVGVVMIEMAINEANNARVRKVMAKIGFQDIGTTTYDGGVLDHVYVNPKYFKKRGLEVPKPFGKV